MEVLLKRRHTLFFCVFFFLSLNLSACKFKLKTDSPQTLHLVSPEKIKGLDPIYADELYSGIQSNQAYETLLQYHYLKRPYLLVPNLAESMPDISQDGRTYLFHLKKGVLFHDDPCFKNTGGKGREMVAEDVVYSFKRLADPKNASSGWWLFDGKVLGLNERRDSALKMLLTDYSAPIEGLKALDRYTVQIKLKQRSGLFLYALAMPFTGVVAHEAVKAYGQEFINHAVGTGPFRLAEYNPNSRIVWIKNPTYRTEPYPREGAPGDQEAGLLDDAGKPLPLADRVVVQVIVEPQPMWLNFMSGKLDLTSIPKDNFSTAIAPSKELSSELQSKGITLHKSSALDITRLTFNMSDPIIGNNKALRQAMSLAYDSLTFIELFYNGRALPAQGPIPPGLSGYDFAFKNPYRRFSLSQAKELLAKAGYPNGKGLPALEYASTADSVGRQMSEYTQKMMSAIGIRLNVNTYSWPQFLETIKNKKAQMWEFAWVADYPDAENFLQLFYSKNVSPGPNDSNYSNIEFDRLYEKALLLSDSVERAILYQKMVSIIVEDCPWIFGAHRTVYGLTQPWLRNYKPNDFDHARYKYYRVDVTLKK